MFTGGDVCPNCKGDGLVMIQRDYGEIEVRCDRCRGTGQLGYRRKPGIVERDHESIQARFERFHEENPHVYELLVHLAREARREGIQKTSMSLLFEVARWTRMLKTNEDSFKLSNDYRSRYARLIMEQEPDLSGLFETRPLTSD